MKMLRHSLVAACLSLSIGAAFSALAADSVMVGGAAMYPSKNIVENAVNSKDHTTLVAALKAAGLVETLSSAGPFTVFAPTNDAFTALPEGTVNMLLKPENKAKLTDILTYHVVSGAHTGEGLMAAVKKAGGAAEFNTVQGEPLIVKESGKTLTITDTNGETASVSIADVMQSNGVIHVIDKVMMP